MLASYQLSFIHFFDNSSFFSSLLLYLLVNHHHLHTLCFLVGYQSRKYFVFFYFSSFTILLDFFQVVTFFGKLYFLDIPVIFFLRRKAKFTPFLCYFFIFYKFAHFFVISFFFPIHMKKHPWRNIFLKIFS